MKKNRTIQQTHPPGLKLGHWNAPDGWPLRQWHWPVDNGRQQRGSMIFQPGRGDFFEKYLESLAAWHDAGWDLRGFDWRGQSGSGRLLDDPMIGHAESFDPWIDDLAQFVSDWRSETPGPHVLAGHSMGGHLVLRYLVDHRPGLDGVLLSAPMLRMNNGMLPEWLAHFIARQMVRFGRGERQAWKVNERPSAPGSSRQKLLTHDFDRYSDEGWWLDNTPELRIGPPSWHWLLASYRSSARMFARGALEAVATPVLIVAATADKLVSIKAIREAARRLPDCRLVEFAEAAHELFRESDSYRDPVMAEVQTYLEELLVGTK